MGQTDKWALPYPEADTLISVSAPIVQELAEKIDAALSAVTASDSYIIPGTLIGDFTTSGTFTPPAGVSTVHVLVVSGGQAGAPTSDYGRGGGAGGGVRVYRNVPVGGPVSITIGSNGTVSSFDGLTTPSHPARFPGSAPGYSVNIGSQAGAAIPNSAGQGGGDGPTVNGTHYAGGGAGGGFDAYGPGGAGGGGNGGNERAGRNGGNGTNGLGGGGGGGATSGASGAGGSGRVMIWTEQTTRDTPLAAVDPVIMAALNGGVMVGAYAVDPVAPVDTLGVLVPFPDEPQPTGEEWTDSETGETHPVLAWPEAGWTYNDGEWSPPDD